ncbi:MAG TPA: hypothetical protein VNL13_04915 [Sulfolobales archaeon]|nr:hypothetical protein [Sulfolobales archaeon]
MRRYDLNDALDNQVMVVAGLTLLATLLSALFASFVLGVFQGSTPQPAIDVRITRISKVAVVEDNVVWDLVLSVRNNGGLVLEIPYIDIVINDDIVTPTGSPNIRSPIPLTIMPGELKVLRIIITNHNDPRGMSNDAIVFSDKRFNSGTMMSLRITDSRGYMVLVTFTLP